MHKQFESIAKLTCVALAALIVARIVGELKPAASLAEVKVPSLEDLKPPASKAKKKSSSSRSSRSYSSRPKLPPEVTARTEAVYQSEIFGPVQRPLPMAVLGLIGEDVIFRAPNGQTKLVKVGDEVDGVKILKVGINRVLVEQDEKQKELTLHSGYGSESLLSKDKKP